MSVDLRGPAAATTLVEAIRNPSSLVRLDATSWEGVLSCARRNAVLAYLGERAWSQGVIDELPEVPRDSLLSARVSAARLAQLARWELDRARRVLHAVEIPMIALKGVAMTWLMQFLVGNALIATVLGLATPSRVASDASRNLSSAVHMNGLFTTVQPCSAACFR